MLEVWDDVNMLENWATAPKRRTALDEAIHPYGLSPMAYKQPCRPPFLVPSRRSFCVFDFLFIQCPLMKAFIPS